MKYRCFMDGDKFVCEEIDGEPAVESRGPYIQSDELPVAMVGHATGRTYTSKSRMRREAKEAGCVEAGDMKAPINKKPVSRVREAQREVENYLREKMA